MYQKMLHFWAKHETIITLVFFAIAIAFPLVFSRNYLVNIGVMSLIYVILSLSINMITGYMGILSLGWAAFYGIGAYTAALLERHFDVGFYITIPAAIITAALAGMLLGIPTLRLSGRYLAIVTMTFCEICRTIEINWVELTRGPMGITGISPIEIGDFTFRSKISNYYFVLVLVLLTLFVFSGMINSRIGRGINAVKDDNIAASAMGVDPFRYKIMIFAVAASFAGLAGAFFAHYIGYIDPSTFTFQQSTNILSMTIIGGMGNFIGSIFGAITLTALPEIMRPLGEWRQVIYGLLLVIMILFRPTGLLGGFNLKHIKQKDGYDKELLAKEGGNE